MAKQQLRQMTERPSSDSRPRIPLVIAGFLGVIASFGIVDVILDAPLKWFGFHIVVEVLFVALCLGSAIYLGLQWFWSEGSLLHAEKELVQRQIERDEWRARAETTLRGLGEVIDEQMASWSLTPAEKETALFVLKGFAHKEIAALCGRSERTVRQHAVSVYKKSGLSGRAELSAFFLEDLLLPGGNVPTRGTFHS
jgi:DNA-binding CsgD family transcriptional regulator